MFEDVIIGLREAVSGFFIANWPILKYIIIPAAFLFIGIIIYNAIKNIR